MKMIFVALVALMGLVGCQHTPEFTAKNDRCGIRRFALEQPLPGETMLMSVLRETPGDMLFLSGGSQNGAFGTGFLDGWQSSGLMPEFSLVTGISTGALQATGAFIGRPDITVRGYTIDSESDVLETYVPGSAVRNGLGFHAALTAIRKGAVADLVPLRKRLDDVLTPGILEAVAARYDPKGNGAYLLVGATDVDLGNAVAFDMTELASRYAAESAESDRRKMLKDCYIDALVASSIVPPGAKPVFIDNRMYIDGGVRYAVFDDRIGDIMSERALLPGPEQISSGIYVILNGDGETDIVCGKVDVANCDPPSSTIGQHKDWDLLSLAFRSTDMLISQVQRLSIDRAVSRARDFPNETYFARIRVSDLDDPEKAIEIPDFSGVKTCNEWRTIDDNLEDPLEFHRRYMRCLIEYGRKRGAILDWDFKGPASANAASRSGQ